MNNKLVLFIGVFVLMANAGAQTTAPLVESFDASGEKTIASKNGSELGGMAAALRAVGDDGADYVLWNGKIYPMSSPDSTATVEAVAIEDDRIVFVGSPWTKRLKGVGTRIAVFPIAPILFVFWRRALLAQKEE